MVSCAHLFLFRELFVFFGEDLGEIQVAHLWVNFCIFGSLFHKETKVGRKRLLWKVWMRLWRRWNKASCYRKSFDSLSHYNAN